MDFTARVNCELGKFSINAFNTQLIYLAQVMNGDHVVFEEFPVQLGVAVSRIVVGEWVEPIAKQRNGVLQVVTLLLEAFVPHLAL